MLAACQVAVADLDAGFGDWPAVKEAEDAACCSDADSGVWCRVWARLKLLAMPAANTNDNSFFSYSVAKKPPNGGYAYNQACLRANTWLA